MIVLQLLPTFIALLVLTYTDIRSRTVPRAIVGLGLLAQGMCFLSLAITAGVWQYLILALISAAVCTTIQYLLALLRPGALGLGDVTTTALITFALGPYGILPLIIWWCASGCCGLLLLAAMHIRQQDCIPYVPAMACGFVIAVASALSMGS